jgi:DNA recombination protein RmuC
LIVWAASKRILIATPASLIALLRSVSISWQQYAQTENAQKIAEAARELYSRVTKFFEHFSNIRKGLEGANSAFDQALGSYTRMVRPAGDRLVEFGGGVPGKVLPDVRPVDSTLGLPPS